MEPERSEFSEYARIRKAPSSVPFFESPLLTAVILATVR
jgi:hypothetical protein